MLQNVSPNTPVDLCCGLQSPILGRMNEKWKTFWANGSGEGQTGVL